MRMRFHANPLTARRGWARRRARSTARGSRRSVASSVPHLTHYVTLLCCLVCVAVCVTCFHVTVILFLLGFYRWLNLKAFCGWPFGHLCLTFARILKPPLFNFESYSNMLLFLSRSCVKKDSMMFEQLLKLEMYLELSI